MRVAITGSTGFVGKNLVTYLNNIGYSLDLIDLRNSIEIKLDADVLICLHGKAHDLKKVTDEAEYFYVNTELTKKMFDAFLLSNTKTFIFLSSIKAVADNTDIVLTEDIIANPTSVYGKSKLQAEKYLLEHRLPSDKRLFILRPCMIHGIGNKGNLNLLYNFVKSKIPWPLGLYNNRRSFCSIDNLLFIFLEVIKNKEINSGIYNVADDDTLSTNDLIKLISKTLGISHYMLKVPKFIIKALIKICDLLSLQFNSDKLNKLTESYVVSNIKLKNAINKPMPLNTIEGLEKTIISFKYTDHV